MRRAVGSGWLAAGLAFTLAAQAAEPPSGAVTQRRIVVMLQDFTHLGCGDCGGLFGGGLIGWEDRKRVAALGEQYAALLREIPGLDIESLARTSFCRELAGTESACAQVEVLRRQQVPQSSRLEMPASGMYFVTLSVEFVARTGLNLRAGYGAPDKQAFKQFFDAWYLAPPPTALRVSPLIPPKSKSDQADYLAARAYWLEGSPSRLELEIRRGIAEVAQMGRAVVPRIAPETTAQQRYAWWSSLPQVSALVAEGKLTCRKQVCKDYVLQMGEDRYWRLVINWPMAAFSYPLSPPE